LSCEVERDVDASILSAFAEYSSVMEAYEAASRASTYHEEEFHRQEKLACDLEQKGKECQGNVIRALIEARPRSLPDIEAWYASTGPFLTTIAGRKLFCLVRDKDSGYPRDDRDLAECFALTVIDMDEIVAKNGLR
jgi:hypothetical protein